MRTPEQIDKALRDWMRSHHGVITVTEAASLDAGYGIVRRKLVREEWDSPYPGVFRSTSAARTGLQDLRAACLFCRGFASHASAAWVWDLLRQLPSPLELSVPRAIRPTSKAVDFTIHRCRDLDPVNDTMTWNNVPVTKPLRTLVDLAATATGKDLSEAVDAALAKRLVTVAALEAEIARLAKRGRPGVAVLRHHLAERGFIGAPAASVLEAQARRLVQRIGLPLPRAEVSTGDDGQYRLDLAWPEILLAVELDGYTWHFSPEHKASDELRRQRLREAGWTVLVFDWRQVTTQGPWVANEIRSTYQRLAAKAW